MGGRSPGARGWAGGSHPDPRSPTAGNRHTEAGVLLGHLLLKVNMAARDTSTCFPQPNVCSV